MTEGAAKKSASRGCAETLPRTASRGDLRQTVSGPDEIEDEIRNLFVTLDL